MRCLTNKECASWIEAHGLITAPYGDWEGYPVMAAGRYAQFGFKNSAHIAQHLVEVVSPFEECLLWFYDGGWDSPPMDALVNAIRRSHGEIRSWSDAPGYFYKFDEWQELAGLFFLTLDVGGSAYLYAAESGTVFFNWEGTLIDAWTKDANHTEKLRLLEEDWLREHPKTRP